MTYSKAELVALGADAILAMDLPETDPNFSVSRRALWQIASNDAKRSRQAVAVTEPRPATVEAVEEGPAPDPRDEELAALRARVAELEARDTSVFADAPLLPAPDALMSDYGPVGTDDITGDLLLDAFEENEAETAAIVQTLSALRLKHLSEQLNVERARLDREHQATGVANPRSASIDRLLGLLTRRGEV